MEIYNEAVDDLPILIEVMKTLNLPTLADECLGTHGNQSDLSNGKRLMLLLCYILSEGNHCKSHVREWVDDHYHTLQSLLGESFNSLEFDDSTLSRLLERLSKVTAWESLESKLWESALQWIEYPLEEQALGGSGIQTHIQLDTTTASGYHQIEPEGWMQYGYSKDHCAHLGQLKIMLANLNPQRLPIACDLYPGNHNDDELYLPLVARTSQMVGHPGILYSGDCKLSSLRNRATIQHMGHCYFCPLQLNNIAAQTLLEQAMRQALSEPETLQHLEVDSQLLARGLEFSRTQELQTSELALPWEERVFLIQSQSFYQSERQRLEKQHAQLFKRFQTLSSSLYSTAVQAQAALQQKIAAWFEKQPLQPYLQFDLLVEEELKTYSRRETRKGQPRQGSYTRTRYRAKIQNFHIQSQRLETLYHTLGWRLYVSNAPKTRFSWQQAYSQYRFESFGVEDQFRTLKGRSVGIRPLLVHNQTQIQGMTHLLLLALKISALMAAKVRTALAQTTQVLSGIYPGQPKKQTTSPRTATLLHYVCKQKLILSQVTLSASQTWHLPTLNSTCNLILSCLGFDASIYQQIPLFLNDRGG